VPEVNVALALEMAADGLGDRVLVGSRDDGVSASGLRARARALARDLPPDIRALACLEPSSERIPVALFGAAWAGVSYAPLNYRLPEEATAELVARLQPAALLEPNRPATEGDTAMPFPDDPANPAVLLFTSGTSAAPKTAVLTHENLLAYVLNTLEFASAGEEEAVLLAVPPFHIAGVAAVLSATYVGRRVVPLARFDASGWLAAARAESVTHAFVVPTMLARIVEDLRRDPTAAPPSLRHVAYGGARMPLPVLEEALALLPHVDFVNAYGLTETSSSVCVLGPEDHRAALAANDPAVRARLRSAGRPVTGVEVGIVDETGAPLPARAVGEIRVRGDQVGGGYLDHSVSRTDDGWLCTGDRGWLDADGYLFVEGRGDETIIRAGENIAAAEIEDALLAHPGVSAAAVVGLPDPEWGEQIAAMVVGRAGTALEVAPLQEFVRDRLGTLKTPDVITLRGALPQTATGKILYREVREELGTMR
jgi:acyl-CoA synthetase (AMP-forming)/AMP-acid ligase II